MSARALLAALTPLTVMMCAAAPPEEGVEVRAAGGYNSYKYQTGGGGCGGTTHNSRIGEVRGYGEVSYRSASGVSVTAESSVSRARVLETTTEGDYELPPQAQWPGHAWTTLHAAVRPGYHTEFGGAELGPLLYFSGMEGPRALAVTLSGRMWAGVPEVAYVWFQLGSGPGSEGFFPTSGGLGHASSWLRAEVGVSTTALFLLPDPYERFHFAPTAQGQVRVTEGLWLGAQVQHILISGLNYEAGTSGMLTLAFAPGQL